MEETAQHLVYVSAHKALLESGVIKVIIINSILNKKNGKANVNL